MSITDWSNTIKPGMFFSVALLAVAEGSIIGCQGKLKVYYFYIRIRAFLFGLLQNKREIAENYLLKFILTAEKCNKFFCNWDRSNFNKKSIKMIKNVSLIAQIRH